MTGRLIMFWDYELQKGLDKSMSGIKKTGHDEYRQTEKILDIHKQYDLPAVFATVGFLAEKGELPYHAPEQVKRIAKEGHEVASHSYEHELLTALTPEQVCETARKSKAVLEKVSKQSVITFVPPHNMPFLAYGMSVYQKPGERPKRSPLPLNTVIGSVARAGYKVFRLYEISLLKKLFGKPVVKQPRERAGMTCLTLSATGFAGEARRAVERAVKTGATAVVYGHPHATLDKGAESLDNLSSFLEFVSRSGVEVTLPKRIV